MSDHQPPPDDATPERFGKAFIALAWVIGLVLLYMLFDGVLERQSNPNARVAGSTQGGLSEVVLQRNRQGHYVATGEINGAPALLMLDTGATDVAIPELVARELGLPRGTEVRVMTANGMALAYQTRLTSVRLGTIELRDVRATIVPGMGGTQVLLGMSFLGQLELNQRGGELRLRHES